MIFPINNNTPFFAPALFPSARSAVDDDYSMNVFARKIAFTTAPFSDVIPSAQDVEMIDVENVMEVDETFSSISEDAEMVDVDDMMDWKPEEATNASR